jgi:hypothetical protein
MSCVSGALPVAKSTSSSVSVTGPLPPGLRQLGDRDADPSDSCLLTA